MELVQCYFTNVCSVSLTPRPYMGALVPITTHAQFFMRMEWLYYLPRSLRKEGRIYCLGILVLGQIYNNLGQIYNNSLLLLVWYFYYPRSSKELYVWPLSRRIEKAPGSIEKSPIKVNSTQSQKIPNSIDFGFGA